MMSPAAVRAAGFSLLLAVSCGRQDSATDRPAGASPRNGDTAAVVWTVRPDSFGPVPLGAALAEAMAALRDSLPIDRSFRGCAKSRAGVMPSGTSLMVVVRDLAVAPLQVERVDVDSSGVRTREGAGVGDLETAVVEMYRGRVRVEPHKYTGPRGHYLVVENPRDTLHRIVFETDGQRVLRYHAGRRPAVDLVEGCG